MKNKKTTIGCLLAIVKLLVITPIWYWLLYQVLVRVDATELMFFLFWAYVPISFLASLFGDIAKEMVSDEDKS